MTIEFQVPHFLLSLTLKATVLLFAVTVIVFLLRRRSAALRHLLWTGCAAGLLLLPVFSFNLPPMNVVLPAAFSESRPFPQIAAEPEGTNDLGLPPAEGRAGEMSRPAAAVAVTGETGPVTESLREGPGAAVSSISAVRWTWLWIGGTVFFLSIRFAGDFRLWRFRSRCRGREPGASANRLREEFQRSARILGLRKCPELIFASGSTLPFAGGIWRSFVTVPESAMEWSEEKRRSVFLHELAHVERRDCLAQFVGHCARALFWFHPLAWWMTCRMRVEREQACDDRVLQAGQSPSGYAKILLDLVQETDTCVNVPRGALAMARRSSFEGRLLALLDPRRIRHGLSRRMAAGVFSAMAAATLVLAMAQPIAAEIERADATSDAGPTYGAVAMLAEDLVVEILAVGNRLADPLEWWAPDGGELNLDPPYRDLAGIPVREGSGQWEFSLILRDPAGVDPGWTVRFPDMEEGLEVNQWSQPGSLDGSTRWSVTANLPEDLSETDLYVGIADGEWSTVSFRRLGSSSTFAEGGLADHERINFAPLLTHNFQRPDEEMRWVAVDRDGREHPARSVLVAGTPEEQSEGVSRRMSVQFPDLTGDDVRELRTQMRPYRWIVFRDVSLRAGHPTEVSVEVERTARQGRKYREREVELAEYALEQSRMLVEVGRAEVRDVLDAETRLMEARIALARFDSDEGQVRDLQMRAAEQRVRRAEGLLRRTRALYENGRATGRDITEAELNLLQERNALRELGLEPDEE